MDNTEEIDDNLSEISFESDCLDLNYLRDMYNYEKKAVKDTESINMSQNEENNIIAKIKEDIINEVRGEMSSELALYQLKSNRTDITESLNNEIDPEIRRGLYEIKRLDKILLNKIKKERQVKRERILLQKSLREQLSEIENSNKNLSSDIKTNMGKFLALKPPPRHNDGLNEETGDDDYAQIFQTELSQELSKSSRADNEKPKPNSPSLRSESKPLTTKSKKNFINRNIELAAKANEPIVLTDAENSRLNELLADLDKEDLDTDTSSTVTSINSVNPYKTPVMLDQSKLPSQIDYHTKSTNRSDSQWAMSITSPTSTNDNCRADSLVNDLTSQYHSPVAIGSVNSDAHLSNPEYQLAVESCLQAYMGPSSYQQLYSLDDTASDSIHPSHVSNYSTVEDDLNLDQLGEQALKDNKYSRETQKRLREIEDRLQSINSCNESEESDLTEINGEKAEHCSEYQCKLDDETLQKLLQNAISDLSRRQSLIATEYNESETEDQLSTSYIYSDISSVELVDQELINLLVTNPKISHFNGIKQLPCIKELNENSFSLHSNRDSNHETILTPSSNDDSARSRFPDINLFRQMTSPLNKNYK